MKTVSTQPSVNTRPAKTRLPSIASKYKTLLNIIKLANARLDPAAVMSTIMDNVQRMIPCEAWSILLLSADQEELIFERTRGVAAKHIAYSRLRIGEGIAGWVAQHRQALIVSDARNDPRFNPKFDHASRFLTKSVLCAPLLSRGRILGVVELINRQGKSSLFTKEDLRMLVTLLGLVSVSLHNALLFQETEKLAITDDLTKLYNNRYIHRFLPNLVEEHRKQKTSFSVIFLDLDGFKAVNDRFGHLVGGKTLVEVGRVIHQIANSQGIVARYGGDEFVIVVPGANARRALRLAERMRSALEEHDFHGVMPKPIPLTASFGISVFPEHAENVTELIQRADQAMYEVKFSGKNAVRLAPDHK